MIITCVCRHSRLGFNIKWFYTASHEISKVCPKAWRMGRPLITQLILQHQMSVGLVQWLWIHGKEIIRALSLTLITVLCSRRDAYSCKSEVDSTCNCEMASKKHEQFIRDLLIRQKINCKKMRALKSGWFLSRPEVAVIDNIIYCIGCSLNKWTIPLSGVTNSFSPCLRNTAKLKILALRLI